MVTQENFDESYAVSPARGNGSCGPNSLGIIFCTYLLSGQYDKTVSDGGQGNLDHFARYWNVYYCANNPEHMDYISLRGIDEIKEKVRGRLIRMAGSQDFRSVHMQQLIAPLLRFSHVLNMRLQEEEGLERYQDKDKDKRHFFSRLFEASTSPDYKRGLLMSDLVKISMRRRETIYHTHNGEPSDDNSPDYATFFNQEGMFYAADLLGLQSQFICGQNPIAKLDESVMPHSGDSEIGMNPNDSRLYCLLTNISGCHYDAVLPQSLTPRASLFIPQDDKKAYSEAPLANPEEALAQFSSHQSSQKKTSSDIQASSALTHRSDSSGLGSALKAILAISSSASGFIIAPVITMSVLGLLWMAFSAKAAYEASNSDVQLMLEPVTAKGLEDKTDVSVACFALDQGHSEPRQGQASPCADMVGKVLGYSAL